MICLGCSSTEGKITPIQMDKHGKKCRPIYADVAYQRGKNQEQRENFWNYRPLLGLSRESTYTAFAHGRNTRFGI